MLALVFILTLARPLPETPSVVIHRVSDRVVVASFLGNNVAAVATARGVMVVDAPRSPSITRRMVAVLADSLGRDDFRWLVNTHGHWDHTWGNQALDGVVRLGHVRCAETVDGFAAHARLDELRREQGLSQLQAQIDTMDAQSPNRRRTAERLWGARTVVDDLRAGFVPTPPDDLFDDRMRIDAGDVVAELIFCGAAHTDHDIFVYVPQERLLMTGDVFWPCFHVDALADVPRLLRVLDDILARSPDGLVVVPGHGGTRTRDELVGQRDLAAARWAGVRPEASAARTLADGRPAETVGNDLVVDELEFHELARRYLGRGRLDRSLEVLEFAIARLPDSALLHDVLAETLFDMGDTAGAVEHYTRSVDLDPHNRNATMMLRALSAGR